MLNNQDMRDIEKIAMNIVYQLDDDSGLSVEFRQANNDKRIDFVKELIQSAIAQERKSIIELIEKNIPTLEQCETKIAGEDSENLKFCVIDVLNQYSQNIINAISKKSE